MKEYKLTLEVVGGKAEIIEFLELCSKIELLGSIGSSRELRVFVDGDGSARLRFETPEKPKIYESYKNSIGVSFAEEVDAGVDDAINRITIGE